MKNKGTKTKDDFTHTISASFGLLDHEAISRRIDDDNAMRYFTSKKTSAEMKMQEDTKKRREKTIELQAENCTSLFLLLSRFCLSLGWKSEVAVPACPAIPTNGGVSTLL